jgi:hypothetical protein
LKRHSFPGHRRVGHQGAWYYVFAEGTISRGTLTSASAWAVRPT